MDVKQQAIAGNIVFIPSNGSPKIVTTIPEGFTPFYSGDVLVLSGEQVPDGVTNITLRTQTGMKVIGDAVMLSQATWHGGLS